MRNKLCSITMLIIIILGLFILRIALFNHELNQEKRYNATIYEISKETKYMRVYIAKIEKRNYFLYIKNKDKQLSIGDKIEFYGTFSRGDEQRNYGGFNYKLYLKTRNISGIFKIDNFNIKGKKNNPLIMWKCFVFNCRTKILQLFNENLKEENSKLLSGILIGESEGISEDNIDKFRKLGLTHMLAISGENFMYIILLFNFINGKIKVKKCGHFITIVGIIFFMELTGNSSSVIRAGIMSMVLVFSKVLHRKYNIITGLVLSFIIQTVYNPYSIFDVGMILSYGGVIGIFGLQTAVSRVIKSNALNGIISANIVLLPILIYNFNDISLIFILSNMLVSFLIEPIVIIGCISFVFRFKIVYFILDFLLSTFNIIVKLLSMIPFLNVKIVTPSIISIALYYILLIILFNNKVKKIIIKKYKKLVASLILIIFILNLDFQILDSKLNSKLLINFVDVGQGDCTLIRYKNTKILIDGGGSLDESYDVGKNILVPYLLDRKIKKIDYVIISHFDSDHVGGLITVLEELNVSNVLISKQIEESENYNKIKEIIKRKDIRLIMVGNRIEKAGIQKIKLENDLCIDILWPNSEMIKENCLNNNSIVCKIKYNSFSMLLTGDIEEVAEEQITKKYNNEDLHSTILKVAHHGSKTSSTQEFIYIVKPKVALIGVGKDNKFGHPSNVTIERLEKIGCKIYRTDLMGEISICVDSIGMIRIKKKIEGDR